MISVVRRLGALALATAILSPAAVAAPKAVFAAHGPFRFSPPPGWRFIGEERQKHGHLFVFESAKKNYRLRLRATPAKGKSLAAEVKELFARLKKRVPGFRIVRARTVTNGARRRFVLIGRRTFRPDPAKGEAVGGLLIRVLAHSRSKETFFSTELTAHTTKLTAARGVLADVMKRLRLAGE